MDHDVVCTLLENFQVQITAGTHSWIADEPPEEDGDDLGPNPFELLLGALGACMTITVTHYAAQGGIPIVKLRTDLTGKWDDQKNYHIRAVVRVRGDLGEKDLKRLRGYARNCAVHKILEHGADVAIEVEPA
jgi:putative redox protein